MRCRGARTCVPPCPRCTGRRLWCEARNSRDQSAKQTLQLRVHQTPRTNFAPPSGAVNPRSCLFALSLFSSKRSGKEATQGGKDLERSPSIFFTLPASLVGRTVGAGVPDPPLELTPSRDRLSGRLVLESTPYREAVVNRTHYQPCVRGDETPDYGGVDVAVVDSAPSEAAGSFGSRFFDVDATSSLKTRLLRSGQSGRIGKR